MDPIRRVKLEQTVLAQFRRGQITIRQAAELLGVTYLEMDELLRESNIPLVSGISLALRRAALRRERVRRKK